MRNKITVVIDFLALVIGALSLYEGWGRVSTVMYFTGGALLCSNFFVGDLVYVLFGKFGVPMRPDETAKPKLVIALLNASYTLIASAAVLEWTRGL